MEILKLLSDFLLIGGLILLVAGTFFFFVPGLLIRWNAIGNTWLGAPNDAERHARGNRPLFSADYAIFANHKVTGGLMWGLSSLFLAIYILYK